MTQYRWVICAMLFFATTVNYLDRQVLSLTWDEFIKPEFHWNEYHYGLITSIFSIVYAVCMLFAGRFPSPPRDCSCKNSGEMYRIARS